MSIGDFISGIFGSKNEDKVKDVAKPVNVDPNAYQYGGHAGGADEAANQYGQQAQQAQQRGATQADFQYNQPNYNNAAQWGNLVGADRGGQSQTANMMLSRAMGQQPSISGMQAHQDIAQLQQNAQLQGQQAQAAQASQAASARGAGGMALAQQNAANNVANAQGAIGQGAAQATQNISNQAQINAANERMQAEQAASGAFGQMRAGDTGMVNDEGQRAQFNAQLGSQQQQFNAGLRQQQGQQNDAMTMGMTQAQMGVRNAQLGASQNQQAQQSANTMGAYGINAGVGGQNAAMNQSNSLSLIGLAAKGAGGVAGALADGGPMRAHKPYLVGERGPELVVPKQDGTVIPHAQTQRIINVSPQVIDDRPDAADTVLSTWGTKPGMTRQEADSANGARGLGVESRDLALAKTNGRMGGQAVEGLSPGLGGSPAGALQRQDEERVMLAKAKQAEGLELSDDEQRKLGGASFRAGKAKQAPKATLAGALGSTGDSTMRSATQIDTSYHGPGGGYVPPQLIQIAGPRAAGGPVEGGQPYLVGEQGPELMAPKTGIGMDMAPKVSIPPAMMVSFGSKGSAGPTAAPGMQDAVSKSWQPQDGTGKTAMLDDMPHREDGGPVEGGKPYVAGEKGPELVVPAKVGVMDGYDPLADVPAERSPKLATSLPDKAEPKPRERQMQSFQREEPFYLDPRMPAIRYNEGQEHARRVASAGDFAASLFSPGLAIAHAGRDLAIDAGALTQRAIDNAKADAGSKPTRGLAKAMGSGAKTLEVTPTETADSRGQVELYTVDAEGRPVFSPEGPHPLPPPKAPPIQAEKKPEKRTLAATMGRAALPIGRRR